MTTIEKIKTMLLDGNGNGQISDIDQIHQDMGLIWIQSDLDSIESVLDKLNLHSHLIKDFLSAAETRPRTLIYGDTLLASFRGVNLNIGSVPEDMIAIRLLIQRNLIITVQRRKLLSVAAINQSLEEGNGPKTPAEFLEILLSSMTEKSIDVIDSLGNQLDVIEDSVVEKTDVDYHIELGNMRRRIIVLRRYLIPQREAISHIPLNKLSWMIEADYLRLREIVDASARLLENLDAERDRAIVLHEELFTRSQEALNKKMYLLTIVAIIFMPLSFITGLLGINVEGIPGAGLGYGFLVVCAILIGIFLIQLFYLKKKRWI